MNKKIKMIISIIVIAIIFMTSNCYALENDVNQNIQNNGNESTEKEIYYDVLYDDGKPLLKSKTLPTTGINLGTQSYKATIVEAAQNWLYTNVYFKVGSNKKIVVNYSFTSSNGDVADIGIYDMTTSTWVGQTTGLNGTWTKSYLNTSHKYVVAFKGHTNPLTVTKINGTAIITN